ncbi:hypothetical protein CJU89_1754 [Yarrowia sp. B02]|nr:hypothetical protein CJU89_1754 [Yarrowia sp. B02]
MHRRSRSSVTSTVSTAAVAVPRASSSRRSSVSTPLVSGVPPSAGVDMLTMETEQEAIFNKLQREINYLKDRRGSQTDRESVSHFRKASLSGGPEEYGVSPTSTASVFSAYQIPNSVSSSSLSSVSSTVSYQETGRQFERRGSIRRASVCGEDYEKLKQENEMLKNKLRDLTLKLADKEHEVELLKSRGTPPIPVKIV